MNARLALQAGRRKKRLGQPIDNWATKKPRVSELQESNLSLVGMGINSPRRRRRSKVQTRGLALIMCYHTIE